jgi:putative endonuclease
MPSEKRKIGDIGEKIAKKWLEDRGFLIREKNYLKKYGEIDIVATKNGKLHFVEVKSVSLDNLSNVYSNDNYKPEDNVHPKKLQRLFKTIEIYLSEKNIDKDWQIDVLSVFMDFNTKTARVRYLENVIS